MKPFLIASKEQRLTCFCVEGQVLPNIVLQGIVMSSSVILTDDAQVEAASIRSLNSERSGSGMGFSSMLVSSLNTMSFTPGVILDVVTFCLD